MFSYALHPTCLPCPQLNHATVQGHTLCSKKTHTHFRILGNEQNKAMQRTKICVPHPEVRIIFWLLSTLASFGSSFLTTTQLKMAGAGEQQQ